LADTGADACAPYRIYNLETQINQQHGHTDPESSPLLEGTADDPDKVFTNNLDAELEKVTSFYQIKEKEIYDELEAMVNDVET
jgi:phosphate transporter